MDTARIDELKEHLARGEQLEYVFFWKPEPAVPGVIDASCLGQWWESPFAVDGAFYRTAEHWMMASKARLFGDEAIEQKVLRTKHPRDAKALGRKVRGFDEATWVAHRYELVVQGNVHKFGEHGELADYLRSTEDRVLVEASPLDRIWGIGLAADDARAYDPGSWRGLNLLGFALMDVRARLGG